MPMLELFGWVFVNICIPALAPIVLPCVLLLTSASPLVSQLILRSISDGQLYWIALAFAAATYSELSELHMLSIRLAAAGLAGFDNTGRWAAIGQGGFTLIAVFIAVAVMHEAWIKVQPPSPRRPGRRASAHPNRRMIVASSVLAIVTGISVTTAHQLVLTARSDALSSERATFGDMLACVKSHRTDCDINEDVHHEF